MVFFVFRKWTFVKSYRLFDFQVRESSALLNNRIPTLSLLFHPLVICNLKLFTSCRIRDFPIVQFGSTSFESLFQKWDFRSPHPHPSARRHTPPLWPLLLSQLSLPRSRNLSPIGHKSSPCMRFTTDISMPGGTRAPPADRVLNCKFHATSSSMLLLPQLSGDPWSERHLGRSINPISANMWNITGGQYTWVLWCARPTQLEHARNNQTA